MPKIIDLKGETFSRLFVVRQAGTNPKSKEKLWRCQCSCGKFITATSRNLRTGITRSCGCLQRELAAQRRLRHGQCRRNKRTAEYGIWRALNDRCYNSKHISYKYYGALGVTVCKRWREDFEAFFKDVGPRPSTKHSIDRKEPNGNYTPKNCRWATATEQRLNQRRMRNSAY